MEMVTFWGESGGALSHGSKHFTLDRVLIITIDLCTYGRCDCVNSTPWFDISWQRKTAESEEF